MPHVMTRNPNQTLWKCPLRLSFHRVGERLDGPSPSSTAEELSVSFSRTGVESFHLEGILKGRSSPWERHFDEGKLAILDGTHPYVTESGNADGCHGLATRAAPRCVNSIEPGEAKRRKNDQ